MLEETAMFLTGYLSNGVAWYRLLLHPLRNYPGPQLAKISDAYSTYHAMLMDLHLVTRQDNLKYGPVMRHGPNKLVFNSARALHDIYDNDRVNKASTYLTTLFTPYFNTLNVIDKNLHRTKRRLIGRVLSKSSMKKFEPIMMKQIDIFIEQLMILSKNANPVNMSDRCKYVGVDSVGHLAFGYDLRLQTSPENRHIASAFKSGNRRLNVYMHSPFLAMFKLERGSYLRKLQFMITSRLKEEKDAKYDLYSVLADSIDTPSGGDNLSLSELWSEALFFVPAGGVTMTTGMTALFFFLSHNREAHESLRSEIRTTFTAAEEIRGGPRLTGCRYLHACIDEALRLAPPMPGTLWRERAQHDEEKNRGLPLIIDGCEVPEGIIFGVNIYALHHNADIFPDPFLFWPERWMPSEETEEDERRTAMTESFAAFQLGPRGCAGKAMAYLEASLVVAKTLWDFDIEPAPGKLGKLGCER
ncbi:cytochrome P450 [Xylariaceae sp. FL0255]|nr:cytochrome P450 [Xylariaceae sp. FL0255]